MSALVLLVVPRWGTQVLNVLMPTKKSSAKKVTKKPTAKKAVKKVVKKTSKVATRSKSQAKKTGKTLVQAGGEEAFWMNNGSILRNLLELKDALEAMGDEVFSHHVTKDKNDFADWVESVLNDPECAAALRKTKKPNAARTVVVRHLKIYSL